MTRKTKTLVILILTIIAAITTNHLSADQNWDKHSYLVVKVIDGDTFEATDGNLNFRVRIAGMDAPERKQAFGKNATYYFRNLVEGKNVTIKPIGRGRDRYNRILGQVYLDGNDISVIMIQDGYAVYYRPKCQDYPLNKNLYDYDPRIYIEAEKLAKRERRGLWSNDNPMQPCDYRKKHKPRSY